MPAIVIYIAAVMLILGVLPLPYGYYTLLRLVATGAFAWAAYVAHMRKDQVLPWIFALLALLFNPLIKIHLPKEMWAVIDVGAGVLLLITKHRIQEQRNTQ